MLCSAGVGRRYEGNPAGFQVSRRVADRCDTGPRPSTRLPEILAADEDVTVVVWKGKKPVDSAIKRCRLATPSDDGAQSAGRANWASLRGRVIMIIPDHDSAGESRILRRNCRRPRPHRRSRLHQGFSVGCYSIRPGIAAGYEFANATAECNADGDIAALRVAFEREAEKSPELKPEPPEESGPALKTAADITPKKADWPR